MKFVKAAFKPDVHMIQVQVSGKDKPQWYACDQKVKTFAKNSFAEGDDIELTIEKREGKDYVTKVSRPGQASAPQSQAPASEPAKYTPNTGKYGAKTPEESEKITRLSVMSSAAQAIQVATGQITDPKILADAVIVLYRAMLAEIKK